MKNYQKSSFDDCIEAAKALNTKISVVENEGFVVVDKNWHRIKIKSPSYIAFHHVINNYSFTKRRCLLLLRNDTDNINTILKEYPRIAYIFDYYKYKLEELYVNVDIFVQIARNFYEEYNHNRKMVYDKLKGHPYLTFGMRSLGNDGRSAKEQLDALDSYHLEPFIDEYIPKNIYKELDL